MNKVIKGRKIMGKLLNEEAVLKILNITDFCQLTKQKIPQMISLLDKMEPEVAKKALEQFPYFADAMKEFLHDYHESLNKAYETNASSVESYYHACSTMIEALQKKMEQDGFSFDEIKYIIEKMKEIVDMMDKKDSENKNFIGNMAMIGGAVVFGIGCLCLGALGSLGSLFHGDSTD